MVASPSTPKLLSLFLLCQNLEKSVEFYRRLGFSAIETRSRSVVFEIGSDLRLHLHEPLGPDEQAMFGVQAGQAGKCLVQSFEVEDLENFARRAAPESILFGPDTTAWGQRLLLLQDPDGHRLEFREGPEL